MASGAGKNGRLHKFGGITYEMCGWYSGAGLMPEAEVKVLKTGELVGRITDSGKGTRPYWASSPDLKLNGDGFTVRDAVCVIAGWHQDKAKVV